MPLALVPGRLYSTDNFSSFVFLFSVGKCLIYTHKHMSTLTQTDPKIVWSSFVFNAAVCFCVQCFCGYAFYLCTLFFFTYDFIYLFFFFSRLQFPFASLFTAISP